MAQDNDTNGVKEVIEDGKLTGKDTETDETVPLQRGPMSIEELFTEARGPSVTVHVKADGTIVADGPESQIASGDFNTPADVTSVLQAAIDEGGHVLVKKHGSPYSMAVGGQDALGEDLCLEMRADTDLEIEMGATLEYANADASVTPPDTATPIVASGISNFRIRGKGKLDAGYHRTDQPDDHRNDTHVIKVGEKEKGNNAISGTGCRRFVVEGLTLSGGCRHGIEVAAALEDLGSAGWGVVREMDSDDGAGDDDFCVGGPVSHVVFRDCHVVNRPRTGSWGNSGFEADDGPRDILFDGCSVIDPVDDCDGFAVGKTHPWANESGYHNARNRVVNCFAEGCGRGVIVSTVEGTVTETVIDGFTAENCSTGVEAVTRGGSTHDGLSIEGGTITNCGIGIEMSTRDNGTLEANVDGTSIRSCNQIGFFEVGTGSEADVSIGRMRSRGCTNGIRSTNVSGESGTAIFDFDNVDIEGSGSGRAVWFRGDSSISYGKIRVTNSKIDGWDYAIAFGSSITSSQITDNGLITHNSFENISNGDIGQPNNSIREYVRILRNQSPWDPTSVEPMPIRKAGMEYFDDGTNRADGNPGYRYYNGSSWVDY